ncbi:MAG: ASCH domain-containing protein, partial [Gammaproteobacteria bacterium]|nr:ASCH domain-containing protein [Gammaproteobacteria bacterium]
TFSDPSLSTVTDEIAELARQEKKRGTAHLALDFEKNDVPQRKPGEYLMVLNSSLEPQCVVQCTNIALAPFRDVTEKFAASEGEGDLSLEYWATVHKRYFVKQLASWGMEWDDSQQVVYESFDLVWPEP